MRLAIEAARFTPEEANGLRRSMATFRNLRRRRRLSRQVRRRHGRGAAMTREFAERCFRQIEGFGSYGFPESHAVSFAKLVYVSAWIKRHHPDVFCAAMLNSQPMGFYQPAQLVRDAREHGVEVRPADVMLSDWDSALEISSSLPSWGGTGCPRVARSARPRTGSASRVGNCEGTKLCESPRAPGFPTLTAARSVPPHGGEGGMRLRPVRLGLRQIPGLQE